MRGRLLLTVMLTGVLALTAAAPAGALLGDGSLSDTLEDTASGLLGEQSSLLGPVTGPLLEDAGELEAIADGVVEDLGTGPLDPALADALLTTSGSSESLDGLDGLLGIDALLGIDDLLGLNWPTYLPAWPDDEYVASVGQECPSGNIQCVDRVIREMQRRYDRLGCHHDTAFALTYLLTTEEYRDAVEDPGFFTDNAFVNHQDAVFAEVYFDAFDDWRAGRIEDVPPAWRVAFDATDREATSGTGDVLLGMNAHIRRDLPFVLEAIGLVAPDGGTRKADHDRVNDILAEVPGPMTEEMQRRHDPSFGLPPLPLELDGHAVVHAIRLMREEAWRKAELLVAADTETERDRVARLIEHDAAMSALAIRTLLPETDAEGRLAHCTAWREGS